MNDLTYSQQWWINVKNNPEKYAARKEAAKISRKMRIQRGEFTLEEKARLRTKKWKQDNPVKFLLGSARQSAKLRQLDFSLQETDIQIPEKCPYLGEPLTFIQGQGNVDTNISLDRIDNSKGYVPGNVEVISMLANRMKLKATKEQLITFAKHILSRYD